MADEYKNVRRIQDLNRQGLQTVLKTKMLGISDDLNPSLGYKKASGEMLWFNSEDGDAKYRSLTDSELSGVGNRNIGVDANGKLILLATDNDTPLTGNWVYDVDVTIDSVFSFNSTSLSINKTDTNGTDKTDYLKLLDLGGAIVFQSPDDQTEYIIMEIQSGSLIDNTSYFGFTVTNTSTGAVPPVLGNTYITVWDLVSSVDYTLQMVTDNGATTTNIMKYDVPKTFTLDEEVVDKKYVDDSVSGSGGLWEGVGTQLIKQKIDYTNTLLGTAPITPVAKGKLEINRQELVIGSGISVIGCVENASANTNYIKESTTRYKEDVATPQYYIEDTGWYWVLCTDPSTPWDTSIAWGAGGSAEPVDSDPLAYWSTSALETGTTIKTKPGETTEGVIESITTNGRIYTEDVIKSSKALQLSTDILMYKNDVGVAVISGYENDTLLLEHKKGATSFVELSIYGFYMKSTYVGDGYSFINNSNMGTTDGGSAGSATTATLYNYGLHFAKDLLKGDIDFLNGDLQLTEVTMTNDSALITKKYVDDAVAGGGGGVPSLAEVLTVSGDAEYKPIYNGSYIHAKSTSTATEFSQMYPDYFKLSNANNNTRWGISDDGTYASLEFRDSSDSAISMIDLNSDGSVSAPFANGKITHTDDLTTKLYVDTEIAGIPVQDSQNLQSVLDVGSSANANSITVTKTDNSINGYNLISLLGNDLVKLGEIGGGGAITMYASDGVSSDIYVKPSTGTMHFAKGLTTSRTPTAYEDVVTKGYADANYGGGGTSGVGAVYDIGGTIWNGNQTYSGTISITGATMTGNSAITCSFNATACEDLLEAGIGFQVQGYAINATTFKWIARVSSYNSFPTGSTIVLKEIK